MCRSEILFWAVALAIFAFSGVVVVVTTTDIRMVVPDAIGRPGERPE